MAELMTSGGVAQECGACGAGGIHELASTHTQCRECGSVCLQRACPRCRAIAYIDVDPGVPLPARWQCASCKGYTMTMKWWMVALGQIENIGQMDGAMRTLYTEIELDPLEDLSDPGRRRLDGVIVELDGVSGVASGDCSVFFHRSAATIIIGEPMRPTVVPFAEISTLQFAGRGELVSSTNGGWHGGGFGPVGIATGFATAAVLNKLTTRTVSSIESIVTFSWATGRLVLLNTTRTPDQLANFFAPVVQRISTQSANAAAGAQSHASSDLVESLQRLSALHSEGMLTDEEFALAKAKLLRA